MSASSAIDQALVAMLGSDTTLLSYMTNGVYWQGDADPGLTKFVEVSLAETEDVWVFQRRAIEDQLYVVKAVMRSTAGAKSVINAAEARIDTILNGQPLGVGSPLTVDGYTYMEMAREQRLKENLHDDRDPTIKWWHRGGFYRVQMYVNP